MISPLKLNDLAKIALHNSERDTTQMALYWRYRQAYVAATICGGLPQHIVNRILDGHK
jgi:hypothetical protein